jgi:hypothetical protein
MAEVKDDAMALRDRPGVARIGIDQLEEFVGFTTRLCPAIEQQRAAFQALTFGEHTILRFE